MKDAATWIRELGLQPHPEGGHFLETYRAADALPATGLPARFPGDRACSTAIYYLLEAGQFSAFHRIRSDEVWHFHDGGPLEILVLQESGAMDRLLLGLDAASGARPQQVVPASHWFAARPLRGTRFTLASCTVAPGFDFADFEMARRADLLRRFPAHEDCIRELTHA